MAIAPIVSAYLEGARATAGLETLANVRSEVDLAARDSYARSENVQREILRDQSRNEQEQIDQLRRFTF